MRYIPFRQAGPLLASVLVFAAMSGSQAAFAAGPVVASASASLSNLQLQVSDFRPDDGITAGAKWVSLGQGWTDVTCCDNTLDFPYNAHRENHFSGDKLINTVPNGVSLPGGAASAFRTANGAKASVLVDADHVGSIYDGSKWDQGSALESQAFYSGWGFELLLDPGTEIKLTGLTTLDASMNLLNSDKIGMPGFRDVVGLLSGSAHLQAIPQWNSDSLQVLVKPEGPDAFAEGAIEQRKSAGQIVAGTSELHESRSFTFVIRNTGAQAQSVNFSLNAEARFWGVHSNVAVVPEPESVALVMVGLMSLACLRRRQKQRNKLVKQAAALCLGAVLLPVGAQAAPLVSAKATIQGTDLFGETVGGFDVEPRAEAFNANSGNVTYAPSLPIGAEIGSGASAVYDNFGLSLSVSAWYGPGALEGVSDEPMTSMTASLDWSDTIINTGSQKGQVSLGFAMPQFIWNLDDVASFKLSIWVEGQSSPAWFTGFDRKFDATQNRSVTVFSGRDIGLRGDASLANLALAPEIQLGSLAAGESFKVHFSVDMSAMGSHYGMGFRTSDPLLKLVTSPVPEPATWAMLLAGLGLTGLRARRRQAA